MTAQISPAISDFPSAGVARRQLELQLCAARLRKNLEESRKAFLNFTDDSSDSSTKPDGAVIPEKRGPVKKISFKIKKSSSIYRRKEKYVPTTTTISANTVQELTKKYNELVEKNTSGDKPKIGKLLKRVNSQKKFCESNLGLKKKIGGKKFFEVTLKESGSIEEENHYGSVKAAIAIFEQKSTTDLNKENSLMKPKVPEKTFDVQNIALRTQERRLKMASKTKVRKIEQAQEDNDMIVEVVNLPLTPPKKCDSLYETMHLRKNHNNIENSTNNDIIIDNKLRNNLNSPRRSLFRRKENEIKEVKTIVYESSEIDINLLEEKDEVTKGTIKDSVDLSNGYEEIETHCNPEVTEDSIIENFTNEQTIPNTQPTNNQNSWEDLYDLVKPPSPIKNAENNIETVINKSKRPLPPIKISEKPYSQLDKPEKYQPIDKNNHRINNSENQPPVPPRRPNLKLSSKLIEEEKIYEELPMKPSSFEDDDYEICEENIYETLQTPKKTPALPPRKQEEPLPPTPPSPNYEITGETVSNFYESIYSRKCADDEESNYEMICGVGDNWVNKSKRDSILSDQTNSIYNQSLTSWAEDVINTYNGRAGSELSSSDRSDEWVDLSDHEENDAKTAGFVIIRERQKVSKKASNWSQQLREQWTKVPRNVSYNQGESDSDHHYESLYTDQQPPQIPHQEEDFDSFDSDNESDNSLAKHDSGVDMEHLQLPEPPNQQTYVLTRLAASAGKHMKKLRRNWSLTKNDITKSLSRMTKRKSRTDIDTLDKPSKDSQKITKQLSTTESFEIVSPDTPIQDSSYQNVQFSTSQENLEDKNKTVGRKGFLNKFRRSMSISGESLDSNTNLRSTFYLTDAVDVDSKEEINAVKCKTSPQRPRLPPPPAPTQTSPNIELRKPKDRRSTSWYAECGLFKNAEQMNQLNHSKQRPNTFWYAEVGLYRSGHSTPSTSSAENSGSTNNVIIKLPSEDTINQDDNENYYNMKNESNSYYNGSINSCDSSDTKKDEAFNSMSGDLQLRLQDEPLYQFYDAAVLESVCNDGTTDFDSDGYEEVGKKNLENKLNSRPSAMELVSPGQNNVSVARTLWCEIPEVIQSTVLSTLSLSQKKLQEAKFEMLTSEASYLNSLNVLTDHFVSKMNTSELLTYEEKTILFGKILPVKECSEKLLHDLERCWQENILLHGVCEIIKNHAEENFSVYVSYCENQVLLDITLKKLKERNSFIEYLRQIEGSSVCQLLSFHSFLMLPMQRITRWPLLLDAVLKRLSKQDDEYLSAQLSLATLNKIVMQCNEGARRMERINEMHKVASQLEFPLVKPPLKLINETRWLVRSGPMVQMQMRGDDAKLTFGKRFTKSPLHLFLFNDLLIVAKSKGDGCFHVQHYCYRSYLEVSIEALACLPIKDIQGRHLIFLTILENHEEKTVEFLLSCNSETDKERWMEALSAPKSDNPDEVLYECWDCPQVTAIHNYAPDQSDELPLSRGDIINVTKKMADGWYHGQRIRDGQIGWFPANYSVEVANPHVRARNLKQRYRLLAFSENYLKSK